MEFRIFPYFLLFVGCVSAQTYQVCVKSTAANLCQSLDKDGSQAVCHSVETSIDCALKLARGDANIGYFSEEEVLLLAQQASVSNENRVVATLRDQSRLGDPYAFEAVAVVPSTHTNGLEGLRNGNYFHPGFDQSDLRWSPRVLKALEVAAAQTDRVPANVDMTSRTADHIEVEALNSFFAAACRPGAWSSNATVDSQLKMDYPQLCTLCGGPCNAGYNMDLGVSVAGVRNDNRHIQALDALRRTSVGANSTPGVAYVAWLHVVQYFNIRNPLDAASFSILCPNGTLVTLTSDVLTNPTSPCAFVRQPWGAIVANAVSANAVLSNIRTWWPNGENPGGNTWQSVAFSVVAGGTNARVVFLDTPLSVANYTDPIRTITAVDASSPALRAQRWCTTSNQEQAKCSWIRAASHSLGILPPIACQQKKTIFECLTDIKDGIADLIASPSNYGYIARQHFKLSPVKMVQNQRASAARIAAFVKETSTQNNITRFENLRGSKACFPEYGGLAYVAFVRAGQERGILSSSECDYARAVGELFSGACAPGAVDTQHALSITNFDTNVLCSACRPADIPGVNTSNFTCAWNYTNMYYGNNGSLTCLNHSDTGIAVLNMQNIASYLADLKLPAENFRALCRNNSLAVTTGFNIDDNCLLAHVVDAEVLTRRNDPFYNSLNVLLDNLDQYFGYNAATGSQLINLEIFSPFDNNRDLLFKDSTIGLTEPSIGSTHEPAKNYIDLFEHLNACTGAAPMSGGFSPRSLYSIISMILVALVLM